MNFGLQIFYGGRLSDQQRAIVDADIVSANKKRIRVLTIISLYLVVLVGFGSNILLYYREGSLTFSNRLQVFVHCLQFAFLVISLLILRSLAKRPDDFKTRMFIIFYSIIFIVLCNQQTYPLQFNTSVVLVYTIGMMLITSFVILRRRWSAVVFGSGFLSIILILVLFPTAQGNPLSTGGLSFFITVCCYVISAFLYNNFIQESLNRNLISTQQQSLEQLNTAKNRVLSIVAHDLRTPVINIDQLADLLQHEEQPGSEQFKFLGLIKESCQQAYKIIDDLLQSREGNLSTVERKLTDIHAVAQMVLSTHFKRLLEKNIHISVQEHSTPLKIVVNESQMRRVFDNLLSNSIKFTPRNGWIKISFSSDDSHAIIQFSDGGIGIPQGIVQHLFKPFSKARRKGIDGEHTTGLGLSIVKEIIELHSGTVEVSSTEGQGTTFIIKLPLAPQHDAVVIKQNF